MVNFFYKISSRMLMGFGSHFGSLSTRDWDSDSSAYIHSRIKNRFFIDLSITNFMLSRALKFVSFCISRGLKFLYFFDQGFGKFLYKVRGSIKFWSNNFYLVHRWVPGTLTNYKSVYGKLVKFRDSTNLLKYPNGLIFLGSNRFLASVSSEARISKLPSIGLSDIDNGYSPFSYTIPSNNKSFPIFYAYYRLFVMSTAYGWAAFKFFYSRKSKSALPRFISRIRYFYNKLPINFFFLPRIAFQNLGHPYRKNRYLALVRNNKRFIRPSFKPMKVDLFFRVRVNPKIIIRYKRKFRYGSKYIIGKKARWKVDQHNKWKNKFGYVKKGFHQPYNKSKGGFKKGFHQPYNKSKGGFKKGFHQPYNKSKGGFKKGSKLLFVLILGFLLVYLIS